MSGLTAKNLGMPGLALKFNNFISSSFLVNFFVYFFEFLPTLNIFIILRLKKQMLYKKVFYSVTKGQRMKLKWHDKVILFLFAVNFLFCANFVTLAYLVEVITSFINILSTIYLTLLRGSTTGLLVYSIK